jgi:hypothetical protein
MMNAKMPSKIAKRPNDGSENIQHRTTSAISASSGRKLEEMMDVCFNFFVPYSKPYSSVYGNLI